MAAARAWRWLGSGLLAWLLLAAASAAGADRKHEAEKDLQELRARITALGQAQQEAATRRDQLNQTLAQQARQLAAAAEAVRASEKHLASVHTKMAATRAQQAEVQQRLDAQYAALAALLRATYKLGHGSDLRLWLGDLEGCTARQDDKANGCAADAGGLARLQRALAYSHYLQADRARQIEALRADLAARAELDRQLAAEEQALRDAQAEQRQRRDSLQAQRQAQQALLARTEAGIAERQQSLQRLQAQRQALEDLLANLQDLLADMPRAVPDEKPFAERRGELPWPLAGRVRPHDGGILIGAEPGTPVRAVAHGRVAFADWLRGYGMLLIVDHGDGWMSLYGNNESLLRGVGDWVRAGEVIASSGRDPGGTAGSFFGLRHDGRNVRPQRWLQKP